MVTASASWPQLLEQLLAGNVLSKENAAALMEAWLAEELTPVQTGAFLAALRARNVQGTELAAMAQVLRKACALPDAKPNLALVDTCGTGGDGANTFNISTAVAFTAAACGATVAKHGNRSASGKVGSADVLEGLGLQLKAPLETVVGALSGLWSDVSLCTRMASSTRESRSASPQLGGANGVQPAWPSRESTHTRSSSSRCCKS